MARTPELCQRLKRAAAANEDSPAKTGYEQGELWPGENELARSVADADFVRRQNRGLILSTLRREGPLSRTQLAGASGLSHASITAIGGELIAQKVLLDLGETASDVRARGRPAIQVTFNRHVCHAILIELDVNRARF